MATYRWECNGDYYYIDNTIVSNNVVMHVGTNLRDVLPVVAGTAWSGDLTLDNGTKFAITVNANGSATVTFYNKNGVTAWGHAIGSNPGWFSSFWYIVVNDTETFVDGVGGYTELFKGTPHTMSESVHYTFDLVFGGVEPSPDPYGPGGYSRPGGGGGTYSFPSDTVDFPGLPTLSAASAGFCTLYNPTAGQLQSLAAWLWGTLDLSQLKAIFASPIDAVLGLNIVPVSPTIGASQTINLGNIASPVSAAKITNQYKEVDCGSVAIDEHWGSYLDYDSFMKCEIYLPYVGVHELGMSEVMGKSVHVKYHVDVLSGSCVAYVKCGDNVLYSFPGTCSVEVPVTASKFGSMLSAGMSMAATAGERIANALSGVVQSASEVATSVFNAGRTSVQKSGSIGGSAGIMSIQYPYLIFTYPNQALPEEQNKFTGYPSFVTTVLSALTGYTEVEHVHLTDIPATSAELEEIDRLLKEGIIL